MTTTILSLCLVLVFTFLGGMHFYWLFGGTWGLKMAIPTKNKETNTLHIPKFATLIVAVVLIAFRGIVSFKI